MNFDFENGLRQQSVSQLEMASPWSRYWARQFDIMFYNIFLVMTFARIAPQIFERLGDMRHTASQVFLHLFWGALCLGLIFVFDAIIQGYLGGSLGKWIAGIRLVKTDGTPISISTALSRNFGLYIYGFALNLPIITLYLQFKNYKVVESKNQTSWDIDTNTQVINIRSNIYRIFAAAFLSIILMIITFFIAITAIVT